MSRRNFGEQGLFKERMFKMNSLRDKAFMINNFEIVENSQNLWSYSTSSQWFLSFLKFYFCLNEQVCSSIFCFLAVSVPSFAFFFCLFSNRFLFPLLDTLLN